MAEIVSEKRNMTMQCIRLNVWFWQTSYLISNSRSEFTSVHVLRKLLNILSDFQSCVWFVLICWKNVDVSDIMQSSLSNNFHNHLNYEHCWRARVINTHTIRNYKNSHRSNVHLLLVLFIVVLFCRLCSHVQQLTENLCTLICG